MYLAYGSKACGGPQGYLAYSRSIDVQNFLDQVAVYTQSEEVFNMKWEVVSTCELAEPPTGVVCEDEKPVFVYD